MIGILTSILPMAINTVGSLIKDKKNKQKAGTEFIEGNEDLSKGISLSSKRLMNVVGTPALIMKGLAMMETQPKYGLIIICLGVAYGVGMAFVSHISEK